MSRNSFLKKCPDVSGLLRRFREKIYTVFLKKLKNINYLAKYTTKRYKKCEENYYSSHFYVNKARLKEVAKIPLGIYRKICD